jgi:hypothetical protein
MLQTPVGSSAGSSAVHAAACAAPHCTIVAATEIAMAATETNLQGRIAAIGPIGRTVVAPRSLPAGARVHSGIAGNRLVFATRLWR